MNLACNTSINKYSYLLLQLALLLFIASTPLKAEPYLAVKNNVKCSSCHVNPIGGGMRNTFGNLYGHTQLPVDISDFTTAEVGKISELVGLGGNFRYNAEMTRDDADNSSSTFKIDSAQIYLAITPKNSGLTLYLDQQVAPGSAINREAFVLYRFNNQHYVKAGKMYVPFGLRLEDDSAFVRQVTGFNFDSSDNGVELGLEYAQSTISFFVTNGTGSVSNNDERFLYGIKGERLFGDYRLGGTAVYNDSTSQSQTMLNIYGGWTWQDITLLAEADYIITDQLQGSDIEQWVGLFEINYQWKKGVNLKFTSEYFDPDVDISDNQESKFSFVAEYAPLSNIQLRAGVRVAESIPQLAERTNERFFFQTHMYF